MNLKGQSFLKILDFSAEEIGYLIDLAAEYKEKNQSSFSSVFACYSLPHHKPYQCAV